MTKSRFKLYDWKDSATGDWSPETGLNRLRDDSPENLADWLWEQGSVVQSTAAFELMAHGNPRKAAEFLRIMANQHILLKPKIKEQYGPLGEYLFEIPLERLPASPKDYSLRDRLTSGINTCLDTP